MRLAVVAIAALFGGLVGCGADDPSSGAGSGDLSVFQVWDESTGLYAEGHSRTSLSETTLSANESVLARIEVRAGEGCSIAFE